MEYLMYNGEVTLDFNEQRHRYTLYGTYVPSVTGITGIIDKPALVPWAVNQTIGYIETIWKAGKEYTQAQVSYALKNAKSARYKTSGKAIATGNTVHQWIEEYINADMMGFPLPEHPDHPAALLGTVAFVTWVGDNDVKFLSAERKTYSREHRYAGTVDIHMLCNGLNVVADIKTSKAIYPEYFLQVAAYALAIEEEDDIKVDEVMIIRVPKIGGEIEIKTSPRVDELSKVFLSCLKVWRWKNGS